MHFLVHPNILNMDAIASSLGECEIRMPFRLSEDDRARLIRVLRRAHALLDLDAGDTPELVAQRYQVARSTIYNWIKRGRTHGISNAGLHDLPRAGRPRLAPPVKQVDQHRRSNG